MAKVKALFKRIRLLVRDPHKFYQDARRFFRPIPREYKTLDKMSLKEWLIHHQNIVFKKCDWMGVPALKNPLDAWIYQEIIHEIKPDIIIEIGSAAGGSTLYFANLLDMLGKGRVISIDIDRTNYKARHNRIITFTGDSLSPEIIDKVSKLCRGKTVLAMHDGAHDREHVLKDLKSYSNLISVGSYFIVEDGIVDLFKPGDSIGSYVDGPLAAVEEFLKRNSDFVVDKERERYILTCNPMGFLKRIR